jgi:large subunit ribosomal protein L3
MITEIYGKKIGMTQLFGANGDLEAATLIEIEPVYILEKVEYPSKVMARIGCFKLNPKQTEDVKKPLKGYFEKVGSPAYRLIREVAVSQEADFSFLSGPIAALPPQAEEASDQKTESAQSPQENQASEEAGDSQQPSPEQGDPREIGVEIFNEGDTVDVRAKTKGKGFAGGMRRHGWSGQPASHGSTTHRRIGSAGGSTFPARIIKGLGMPGHMGNVYATTKNLKVAKIDRAKNTILIKGSVPGARGTIVRIKKV